MNQVHGKSFSLQHITVKVPGQFMPIAKATYPSPSVSLPPDIHTTGASQSDCSESTSPSTAYPGDKLNTSDDTAITVTPSSPDIRGLRVRSPTPDGDSTLDELTKSDKYPFSHRTISHMRNSSMDEITLQYLKTQGAVFYPQNHSDDQPRERASTLTRLNAKKPRKMPALLSPISHSEEDISEPQRTGSAENLKSNVKRGKKGDKDRNSLVLVERTSSDSIPNSTREEPRKDKKVQVGKHKRQKSQGLIKTLDVDGCKYSIVYSEVHWSV